MALRFACLPVRSLLAVTLFLFASAPILATSLEWARFEENSSPFQCNGAPSANKAMTLPGPPNPNHLSCGSYGEFFFGETASNSEGDGQLRRRHQRCQASVSGSEEPAPLVPPATVVDAGWLPCEDGACLSEDASGPYVAAIDWNNAHGWEVAHTIRQASIMGADLDPVEVKLFDLTAPGIPEIEDQELIGDAHLLVQLCRIAEDLKDTNAAPVAINMSFGRTATHDENDELELSPLGEEVAAVLEHLRYQHGVFQVAAAGNHGQLEFPAVLPGVLSVGYFDPLVYFATGETQPSLYSPEGAQALSLAYGIVLEPFEQLKLQFEYDEAIANGEILPEPVATEFFVPSFGSSFASALTSGIAAGCIRENQDCRWDLLDYTEDGLAMNQTLGNSGYAMTFGDEEALEGTVSKAMNRLIDRAVTGVPSQLDGSVDTSHSFFITPLHGEALEELDLGQSWAEINKDTEYGPSPGMHTACRPCGGLLPGEAGMQAVIEFNGQEPLAEDAVLADMIFRIGETLYRVDTQNQNVASSWADFLLDLEAGVRTELVLSGFPVTVDKAATVVFVLERTEDQQRYWHHSPLWSTVGTGGGGDDEVVF